MLEKNKQDMGNTKSTFSKGKIFASYIYGKLKEGKVFFIPSVTQAMGLQYIAKLEKGLHEIDPTTRVIIRFKYNETEDDGYLFQGFLINAEWQNV